MAKTTAPLLSFGATGTIADTMTFARWKGIPYARQRVVPANPRTAQQTQTRTAFSTASASWRLLPSLITEVWNAFATGRPLTGRNGYVGRYVEALRGAADLTGWIVSPGVRSAMTVQTFTAAGGTASGEIDITYTLPPEPDGWTLDELRIAYALDKDPSNGWTDAVQVDQDTLLGGSHTITGLDAATAYAVAGFLVWTRPDGQKAYGVSLTDIATSTA